MGGTNPFDNPTATRTEPRNCHSLSQSHFLHFFHSLRGPLLLPTFSLTLALLHTLCADAVLLLPSSSSSSIASVVSSLSKFVSQFQNADASGNPLFPSFSTTPSAIKQWRSFAAIHNKKTMMRDQVLFVQHPYHTNPVSIQGSSALVPVDLNENHVDSHNDAQNGGYQQAESLFRRSQKLEADLHMLGMKIKQHEDNLNNLNAQKSKLDNSILHLQVTSGKSESSNTLTIDNGDSPLPISKEEVNKQILQHEKSAAGILCQIKTRFKAQASHLTPTKDVVGIVATLGQVEDDNLSRLFSEYIGLDTMLALVCRTIEGIKALEMHDKDGIVNKSSGLHGLGASIGRALDGRFLVICLESLRPYPGTYMADDAQRKLDILNPRFPNGSCPPGFIGFAVNMINIDSSNLFGVTPSGYGLRETLFYNLFSRTQVYKTRADMVQALPCISDGALSLDGGMIRSCGVFYMGNRVDIDVRFPRPEISMGIDNSLKLEMQLKDLKSQKENILEDLKREQTLLDVAKVNFQKKKNEYIRFLAESSANATTQVGRF